MPLLGIEIGGTKLQLVTGDAGGNIFERRNLAVNRAQGASGIQAQITTAIRDLLRVAPISQTGVGFGGPVDWRTGRICRSHQIEGWSEFELGQWLEQLTGTPVSIDNDANVGALGEAHHGAGRGLNPVFYITLGSGVGGGLIVNERIYHGALPGESEIGHVRLDRAGATVESRCSGWAIDARIRKLNETDPTGLLAKLAAKTSGPEAGLLAAALERDDDPARRILRELADDLAFGLSHVVHLFHPEVVILGGGLSGIGEPLRAAVSNSLQKCVMEAFQPGLRIALSTLGKDAVPVGALHLAEMSSAKNDRTALAQ